MGISFGSQIEVTSSGNRPNVTRLTDTKALVSYIDGSSDLAGTIVTLSGGSLSTGTEKVIDASITARENRVARLSDTKMIIAYNNTSLPSSKAVVITISGTTITAGTPITLTDDMVGINHFDLVPLDSSKAVLTYRDGSSNLKARVLSVSGTTVTENSAFTYDLSGAFAGNKSVVLSSTKVIVSYRDTSNSNRPTGQVLDISGTTITGNSATQLSANALDTGSFDLQVVLLDSDSYLCYFKNSSDNLFDGVVVNESSGTLTPGSTQDVSDGTNEYFYSSVSGTTIAEIEKTTGPGDGGTGATVLTGGSFETLLVISDSVVDALTDTEVIATFTDTSTVDAMPMTLSSSFSGYDLVLGGGQP